MMRFKILLSTTLLFISILTSSGQSNPFSQSTPSSSEGYKLCSTSELAYQLYQNDSSVRNKFNASINNILAQPRVGSPFPDGVIRIPVNFIVIHNNGAENISSAQIESQIRILNESYRKIPGTPGNGNGVDTEIEFFLAQKDPNGNCIDGIERHSSTLTIHNIGSPQLSTTFPPLDPSRYLNIYIVTSIGTGGVIGYTYLASANNGSAAQNVIYLAHHAVGDIGTAGTVFPAISSGTVLAHEIGHWLDLLHVFEPQGSCPGNCNTTGDFCCDTPPQQSASPNGCNPANSCGSANNINNYMDYGSDNCFNMFTGDQKSRMINAATAIRNNFADSMNAIDAGYYGCLGITYCQSEATNTSGTEIRNVNLTNVNKSTSNDCVGYSSFNTTFANVTQDSTYTLSVTTGHCTNGTAPNHEVKAYIDWNRDGDFLDAGEDYSVKANGPAGTGTVTITVPGNAPLDRTGLRIIATDGGVIGPCNTYAFGETEDYGIQVLAPPPSITSFSPASGNIGSLVFIVGDNFTGATSVTFNNTTTTSMTVLSDDSMRVNVPANATTGNITVTTPIGSDISAGIYTVTTPLPSVNNFTPSSGFVGDPVTIFGSNLGTVQQVYFNSTPVTSFTQPTAIQIDVNVPPGATTGKIQVQNSVGLATSANDFTVLVPPTSANIAGTTQTCDGISTDLTFNLAGTPPFDLVYTDGTTNFTVTNIVSSPHIEPVSPGLGSTTFTIVTVSDTNLTINAPDPSITGSAVITVLPNPSSGSLTGGNTICEGDTTSITFNAVGGTGPYDISIDNGLGQFNGITDGAIINVTPSSTTTYALLSLSDDNNCSTSNFTGAAATTVIPGPDANFASSINNSIVSFTDQSVGAVSWSWDFGDSTTSNQQNPVHVYSNIGIKQVILSSMNASGCSDQVSKNLLILNVSGLDGLNSGENISIFPNPVGNNLNIEIQLLNNEKVEMEIVNLDGKQMMTIPSSIETENHKINVDVDGISSGMYILNITLSDGRTFNTKFYKE